MPEEKVSPNHPLAQMRSAQKIFSEPPASDAGPRCPDCGVGYKRKCVNLMSIVYCPLCGKNKGELDEEYRFANPPVPQEAAPELGTCYYNSDEHTRNTHGPKFPCQQWVPATAPSWAMRVAIDICRELYDRFVMGGWEPQDAHEQCAEFIRQAGSERERELHRSIQQASRLIAMLVSFVNCGESMDDSIEP